MMMVNRVHFVRHMNHNVFTEDSAIIVYVMSCIFIFIKLHLYILTLYISLSTFLSNYTYYIYYNFFLNGRILAKSQV